MKKRNKRHSPDQIVRKLRDADVMLSAGNRPNPLNRRDLVRPYDDVPAR